MTPITFPHPRLTVVGAGIGDPKLMTIKAVKALQQADVVLYDALTNDTLFECMRTEAVRVYVGKRRHQPAGCGLCPRL